MKTLSYAEAAAYLRINEGTLRNWIPQQKVPYHKVGRRVIFFQEELEQWILAGGSGNSKKAAVLLEAKEAQALLLLCNRLQPDFIRSVATNEPEELDMLNAIKAVVTALTLPE